MRLQSRRRTAKGDTIVEVLIAMAVVSSVMAGAFTVSQKSTLAVRDSQERGEMLHILQGQVELVRSIALSEVASSSGIYSDSPQNFCINPATKARVTFTGSNANSLPPLQSDPLDYTGVCGNISGRYNVAINYDGGKDVFIFTGRWDRVGGGKSGMQLAYRVEP